MVKVMTTIVAENNMSFGDVHSFETEGYIGFWGEENGENGWYVFAKDNANFTVKVFGDTVDLAELDEQVYNWCNEHIVEVYNTSKFKIELVQE